MRTRLHIVSAATGGSFAIGLAIDLKGKDNVDRMTRMVIRAYLPSIVALGIAFALLALMAGFEQQRDLARVVPIAKWLPLAAFAYSLVYAGWITRRLWRHERGETKQTCSACGGLLGRERAGRDGAYRACLACDRRTPPNRRTVAVASLVSKSLIPRPDEA